MNPRLKNSNPPSIAELGHALSHVGYTEEMHLPAAEIIMGIAMLAMLPIILMQALWNSITRWVAVVIVGLMFVFHVLHIAEHGMAGDVIGTIWIVVTGVLVN